MRLDRAIATTLTSLAVSLVFLAPVAVCSIAACGSSLPFPPAIATPDSDFIDVPYPPPAARVEFVPPRPNGSALWIDGAWTRDGTRWRWKRGGWFEVPAGVYYSQWETRRPDGTRLVFANPAWRDAKGVVVPDPKRLVQAQTNFNEEAHDYKKLDGGDDASDAAASLTTFPNSDTVSDSGILAHPIWGDAALTDAALTDAHVETHETREQLEAHAIHDAAADGGDAK